MKDRGTTIAFWITLVVTVILFIGGFLSPPIGDINPSILKAGTIMALFAIIGQIPAFVRAVRAGQSFKIQKGDLSFETSKETKNTND